MIVRGVVVCDACDATHEVDVEMEDTGVEDAGWSVRGDWACPCGADADLHLLETDA